MSKRRQTLTLGYKRLPASSAPDDDALAELLAESKPAPLTLPRQRGKYAWEEFGAARSLATSTDFDLLSEVKRRAESDPALAELLSLMLTFSKSQSKTQSQQLLAGIKKTGA